MINRIEIIPNQGYGICIKKDREIVGWVCSTINRKYLYIYQGNKSSETFDNEDEAIKTFLQVIGVKDDSILRSFR